MESLGFLIVYLVVGYFPTAIAAYALMSKANYGRLWRAWIPLWNVFMLADLAERSRLFLLLLFVPLVNFLVLPMISGNLAELTGRPKWVGWIAGVPGVQIFGLPILAVTATSENNLPRESLSADIAASTERTEGEFRYRYRGKEDQETPPARAGAEVPATGPQPDEPHAYMGSQSTGLCAVCGKGRH